jgi:hypothetical protein
MCFVLRGCRIRIVDIEQLIISLRSTMKGVTFNQWLSRSRHQPSTKAGELHKRGAGPLLDEAKSRPLMFRVGYRYLPSSSGIATNRVFIEVMGRVPLKGGLLVSERTGESSTLFRVNLAGATGTGLQ